MHEKMSWARKLGDRLSLERDEDIPVVSLGAQILDFGFNSPAQDQVRQIVDNYLEGGED